MSYPRHVHKAAELLATLPGDIFERLAKSGCEFAADSYQDNGPEYDAIMDVLTSKQKISESVAAMNEPQAVELARRIFRLSQELMS